MKYNFRVFFMGIILIVVVVFGIYKSNQHKVEASNNQANVLYTKRQPLLNASFKSGSVSPSSVAAGESYIASCDYGHTGDGVYIIPGSGNCTYSKFSGTTAKFNCVAGTTAGTFQNLCKSGGPYISHIDEINSIVATTPTNYGIPTNAIVASNLEDSTNWKWEHDTGTSGSSSGTSNVVSSPSTDGASREFSFNYTKGGGERYSVVFGNDTSATHFMYDAWVYLKNPASVQNLELDMNQVTANGQTIIYATQCSENTKTWEYTAKNDSGKPYWVKSNIPCNPRELSANTWHHIQIADHRDDSGNVTYDWVNVDGTQTSFIGATAHPSFSLGWKKGALVTNFQAEGMGDGSVTLYADKITIWRW